MTLYVKNMVCNRCVLVVKQVFEQAGLTPAGIRLGEVDLPGNPEKDRLEKVEAELRNLGFELLNDRKQKLIEKIRGLLIEKIQSGAVEEHFRVSDFLAKKLNREYSGISRLFSEVEGITVEQYFILQKIEKVKEWLVYGEMNLNEMAFSLGYSSTAHLSAQFKKMTGLTTGHFKKTGALHRRPLDKVRNKPI